MAELKSLLSNPDFLARASVSDVLGNALLEPGFRKVAAVASSEGNDMADLDTFVNDLTTLSYYDLEAKRGRKVADNRSLFQKELARQVKVRDAKPSIGDVVVDTGIAAGTAITSMIGGLSVAGVGLAGAAIEAATGNVGVSRLSTDMGAVLSKATNFMTTGMSDTQLEKAELNAIESNLDQADSTARMNRKIAAGVSPFMADLERQGEDFLNFGDRFYKDPYVATNLIAGALGSLWPSAKLAQGGVILAEKLAARAGNKFGMKIAGTIGSSLGIGFAEASGTFVDTSAFVMGLSEEDMWNSPEYALLRSEGKSHEQAQSVVATTTATEASARQLPTAAILGLVAAKFNANPLKVFKGKGTVNYFREVGIQTFEEGAQGFSSVLNRNLALQNQVDANIDVGAGLGEALGEGMFAGAGMAGVIGAPSLARSGASATIKGALAAANQIPLGAIGRGAKVAGTAGADVLDFASRTGSKVKEATAPLRSKIAKKIKPVTEPVAKGAKAVKSAVITPAAKKVMEKAQAIIDRPNAELHAANVRAAEAAVLLDPENKEVAVVRDLLNTLTDTRMKQMDDPTIIEAAKNLNKLRAAMPGYSGDMQKLTMKALGSKTVGEILARAKKINLNEIISDATVVTEESIQITLDVAEINPVNVNPDHIDKILKQEESNLSNEQVKILTAVAKMARAMNTHQEVEVEVLNGQSIALSKKPSNRGKGAKTTKIEDTSRSVQIKGFTDASGKSLRSIADYITDILVGVQSKDGKFLSGEGGVASPVSTLIKQYSMFVEHLRNKVEALSISYANPLPNGKGSPVRFRSLVGGREMVNPGQAGNADPATYHRDSPGSIAFAQAVENDARLAAEMYNILVETFPESFPGGKVAVPKLNTTTTAAEAVETNASTETEAKPETKAEVFVEPTEVEKIEITQEDIKLFNERESLMEELNFPQLTAKRRKDINRLVGEINKELGDQDVTTENIDKSQARYQALKAAATAAKEDTTADDETISTQSEIDEEAETQPSIQKDLDALNAVGVGKFSLASDEQVEGVKETTTLVSKILGIDLSKSIRQVFLEAGEGFTGYARWAQGVIALSKAVLDVENPKKATHVLFHELSHVWDFMLGDGTTLKSVIDGRFSSKNKGDLYQEIIAAILKDGELKKFFSYALEFTNDAVKSQELFAELVTVYLMNPEYAKEHFPKGIDYVEDLIEDNADAGFLASGDTAPDANTSPIVSDPPTEKFGETFDQNEKDLNYHNGQDLLDLLEEGTTTTEGYMGLVKTVFTKLMDGMNARLASVTRNPGETNSIRDRLMNKETLSHVRQFKNTMIVNPETGEYNPEFLSIAVVAMIDWMSSVRPVDSKPRQLKETFKSLGINASELTRAEYLSILHGVQPTQVAEQLAKTIIRMWNMKINQNKPMSDARGAVEGLVKEMLAVVVSEFDYIKVERIPVPSKGPLATTPTLNVKGLRKVQQEIKLDGQNSIQKLLAPEEDRGPSIGKKIKHVPKMNRRGTAPLSKDEQKAIRVEQDSPHYLAVGITGLIKTIGFEVYKKMQGWRPVEHLTKNHPLRNSIEGKNLSILRDWEDAHAVTEQLENQDIPVPVYYRIDITQVGRHQHSGINSQNNKTLRVMVATTGNTLDMTNQDDADGFWLTVAQASGLGADFKVENVLHEKILATIQQAFAKEYGEAIEMIENYLNTGKLDENALFEVTGKIEMETLNAIQAVAELNIMSRKTNALTEFYVTLGFELDGKTDGPSHMLNNMGQGLLTEEDYTNFQRVGLFLGTKLQTLNKFFSEGASDLYKLASKKAMNALYSDMANSGEAVKASLYASSRFAYFFGDFKLGADGLPEMTRDSTKNPMTQTVYGAGLFGVARGISEDMVLKFYEEIIKVPKGQDAAEYLGYPDLEADFKLLFNTKFIKNLDWTQHHFNKASMDHFADIVTEGIGEMIATAAKQVMGREIVEVNDLLVYITNVQTEFLVELFERRLGELAEALADKGEVRRNSKGVAIISDISTNEYNKLVKSMEIYSPRYDNGMQILAVGGFGPAMSKQEFSANMEGDFRMKSTLTAPEVAGVKVIPYLTQGRGDAMVLTTFYSKKGAPTDTMAVHDGIYIPIKKIKQYSIRANEAVMEVWDRDVIGDVLQNFELFATLIGKDEDLLRRALNKVKQYPQDTSVEVKTLPELMAALKEMHRQNQARKNVFKRIPRGVDHLAGAGSPATSGEDGVEMDRHEINDQISDELGQARLTEKERFDDEAADIQDEQIAHTNRLRAARNMKAAMDEAAAEDGTEINIPEGENAQGVEGVVITDTNTLLGKLLKKSKRLSIRKTVEVLSTLMAKKNWKVVIATDRKALLEQYTRDVGDKMSESHRDGLMKRKVKGWVNVRTQTIYLTSNNHETLVHEMIHVATYEALIAHYEGTTINPAVVRLETLMKQFMNTDYEDASPSLKRAVNAAKASILDHQTRNTVSNNAGAISEFMAWTLSTNALVKDLKTRKTSFTTLLKKALILIKRIVGHKIPDDMYTHILFNTLMLDEAWAQKQRNEQATLGLIASDARDKAAGVSPFDGKPLTGEGDVAFDAISMGSEEFNAKHPTAKDDAGVIDQDGDHNDNGNEGGEVTPAAHNDTNFWIDLVQKRLEDAISKRGTAGGRARAGQFERYQKAADNAVIKLDFGGFVLSDYQKKTFKAIHMVLATEMRLNVNSSVAINKTFEHIIDGLTPAMFGPGKQGQDLYDTVRDLLGDTKNDEGVTDAMAVLLALSQTSQAFRDAIEQIPEPKGERINTGSLNQALTSVTGILMNKLVGTIDLAGTNARELLDVLADNLIQEEVNQEYAALRGLMGTVSKADKFMKGAFRAMADSSAEANRGLQQSERSALTKLVVGTVTTALAFLHSDRAEALGEGAKRLTHMGTNFDSLVMVREFVTEVVGTDKSNAEIMRILDKTTYEISALRQNFKEDLPVIFQDAFQDAPDAKQWKAVHWVLAKLDIATLFDLSNPERTLNLLTDNSLLSSETAAKEAVINKAFSKKVAAVILEKAKQLAGHMNDKGPGHQLWSNAYAINRLTGKYDDTMTKAIDELVSLYALEIVDQAQKDTVSKMYEKDPDAIKTLITYMQALNKEEDMKFVSEKAKLAGFKGFVPNLGAKNTQIRIEDDAMGEELIKMGWTRVGDYTGESDWTVISRGYYVTSVKQGGAYAQGAMQTVQATYRGVNALTGLTITGQASGVLDGDSMDAATESLNFGDGVLDPKEVVVPKYNEKGEIYLYERWINPDLLEKYTRPKANLALMLGSWAGRQMEEKYAAGYNRELVDELKRIWDTRAPGDDDLFVDLSDPNLKDAIYRDSWDVIPPGTKNDIKFVFGKGNGFMVKKADINIALGYRDPSIVDIWTGVTRMPKALQTTIQAVTKLTMGDRAVTILSRGEEGIQGTVASAKDLIVVRSLIVPYMNTQANIFQLQTRGVGLQEMAIGYKDKFVEIERFNVNTKKILFLDTRIALAGNDANQIAIYKQEQEVIRDENKRMSIAPLIEAGQYKNISEGITDLDVELTSGRMAEWVESQMNRLPGKLQTIVKYGFLSKDTAIYKAANKAVQYGDFLAKSILYDHYLAQGMDKTEALRNVAEEYVNFTVLPGRVRSGLEALGATWFLSFKIRITKVAMNILRENPARALIMATTFGDVGSPTGDNLPVVMAEGRFPYSLGWGMLFEAPKLNPLANALDL